MKWAIFIAAAMACAAATPDAGVIDLGQVEVVDAGPPAKFLLIIIPAPKDHDCRPNVPLSACDI